MQSHIEHAFSNFSNYLTKKWETPAFCDAIRETFALCNQISLKFPIVWNLLLVWLNGITGPKYSLFSNHQFIDNRIWLISVSKNISNCWFEKALLWTWEFMFDCGCWNPVFCIVLWGRWTPMTLWGFLLSILAFIFSNYSVFSACLVFCIHFSINDFSHRDL